MKKKFDFVFFGSSSFGYWALKTILKKYKPALVITLPAKPKGRGLKLEPNIIFSLALKEKLPVVEIDNWDKLSDLNFDFGLIAGFGKIIPVEIFEIFKKGILNLHPSLLPKYRGPNPIREPILNGDEKTGATLFLIDKGVDTGPIAAQKEFDLKGNEILEDLEMKLGQIAGNLFNENIEKYLSGEIKLVQQNNSLATQSKKISKIEGLLKIEDGYEIWNRKIRALNPWPGTYIKIKLKRKKEKGKSDNDEKLLKIFIIDKLNEKELPPEIRKLVNGRFFQWRNELGLKTIDAFIAIKELQLQDKKRMTSREFLNGYAINSINLY